MRHKLIMDKMNIQNLPKTNDRSFLMHRKVVVTNAYELFRLIKVHYAEETTEFYVDACALTAEPDYTDSISLGMLRGSYDE